MYGIGAPVARSVAARFIDDIDGVKPATDGKSETGNWERYWPTSLAYCVAVGLYSKSTVGSIRSRPELSSPRAPKLFVLALLYARSMAAFRLAA